MSNEFAAKGRAQMQHSDWISYGELAWTKPTLSAPDDHAEEAGRYAGLIKKKADIRVGSLLHLGRGAGGYDHVFKQHFNVTGVDISEAMLRLARTANPDVSYLQGDMRSIELMQQFDAVAIPDSIDYMVTLTDLQAAVATACRHLRPGGVLIIVAKTREDFRANNFCYAGARDGVEVTLFENNYVLRPDRSRDEATLIYLIRRDSELRIRSDRHTLGLFSRANWLALLADAGLRVEQVTLDGMYDRYILGGGAYLMQVFIGVKPS